MVEKAQADSKEHVDDPKNNRHLHLEGVKEGQFIGCDVPNLLQCKKNQKVLYKEFLSGKILSIFLK